MNNEKSKIDKNLKPTGDFFRLFLPYYTKTSMRVVDSFSKMIFKGKRPVDIKIKYTQIKIPRKDGTSLRMCVYSNKNSSLENSPVVLWFHGGGFAMSEPEQDYSFFKKFIKNYNAVVFAPAYTKSVEKPFPSAFEDAKLSFEYIKNNANNFGFNASKIFVGGDSAGGGLAFSLSLYARDTKDNSIAFVMSIYPMISHRLTQTSVDNKMPIWNTVSNINAWKLYIGDFDKSDPMFKYASPSEEKDFSNLPPVLTYIGTEDPFYAETLQLIANLKSAGVKVDFKIFEGCYHGFDVVCPFAKKSKEAREFLINGFDHAVKNYLK